MFPNVNRVSSKPLPSLRDRKLVSRSRSPDVSDLFQIDFAFQRFSCTFRHRHDLSLKGRFGVRFSFCIVVERLAAWDRVKRVLVDDALVVEIDQGRLGHLAFETRIFSVEEMGVALENGPATL